MSEKNSAIPTPMFNAQTPDAKRLSSQDPSVKKRNNYFINSDIAGYPAAAGGGSQQQSNVTMSHEKMHLLAYKSVCIDKAAKGGGKSSGGGVIIT